MIIEAPTSLDSLIFARLSERRTKASSYDQIQVVARLEKLEQKQPRKENVVLNSSHIPITLHIVR